MSSVNPEKWQEIKEIFYHALQLAPEEREVFLDASCKDDNDLRREVELILASSEAAGSFMQDPAIGEVAEVITAANEDLSIGQRLNHYTVLRLLGEGGMGKVYLAQDTRLERKVALKILPEAFAREPERMRRFVREAKAASALNHPNILTIYEASETESTNYIASEYVEGEAISERLRRELPSPETALDIAVQIASALQAAHEAGIVHRDIKPDNVMIRPDGVVKLLDFGIAKLTEKQNKNDSEAATAVTAGTTPGMIIGTANYMSPEQAKGNSIDVRSDIFSFGLVLYEMLSRKRAFEGANAIETVGLILHKEPVPLGRLIPNVPREIERIVGKTLRKDREERYQTAKDLLIDLKDARQELEFQNKLERTSSPAREEAKTQALDTTTATGLHEQSSSAEYLVKEISQHKRGAAVGLVIFLFAIIGLGYWYFSGRPTNAKEIESIAVMPFVNQSGNADAEYLSDGMTESLISSLSQIPKLNVRARSSAFRYKGTNADPRQIARELNVQAILNGRVVERGQDLSLYVELVDVAADKVIWSQTYNRQMSNLVALQSEIARDVSNNLRTKLSGADEQKLAKNYTGNTDAYRLYLKGQYEWNKHTKEDLQKAIEYYNQAIEVDPNYALAYVGLSGCYGVLATAYLPPNENFPKAKAYAAKALAIDDELSEAHSALGAVKLLYEWDWPETEKEFDRAKLLDPKNGDAHQLYAAYLEAMGRFDEALTEARRAEELDPLSARISMEVGSTLYYARHYDEAIAQLRNTINLEPRYVDAYQYLGQSYEQKKMYAQAIETYQNGMTNAERHPSLIAELGHAYALAGEREKAQKTLAELHEMSKQRYISPYLFAVVHAGLGDKDQTFAWLDKTLQERSVFLIWLKVEPQFDPLRDDPRFQDLLKRIGL